MVTPVFRFTPQRYDLVVFLIASLAILLYIVLSVPAPRSEPLPYGLLCEEDEVIVGRGDYVSGRGWDAYQCQPLDDIILD